MQNTYANEAFLDECAAAANADPVDYRLRVMPTDDPRGREVLERVARLANWQTRPSPRRRPRGDILRPRRDLREVRTGAHLCRRRGRGRGQPPHRRHPGDALLLTHDCGQMINPDGLRSQVEGNIIHTLSRTLKEELTFDRCTVTSRDWACYQIITSRRCRRS